MPVGTVLRWNVCWNGTKGKMPVGIVQKASAHAHWYAKVRMGDSVLIPTFLRFVKFIFHCL